MRKDLLLRLADLLEADANNPTGVRFDLRAWAAPSVKMNKNDYDLTRVDAAFDTKADTVPVSCGTSACALGLAAISGAFEKEGLSWSMIEVSGTMYQLVPEITVGGERYIGFEAGMHLFDISYGTSLDLFDPGSYDGDRTGKDAEMAVVEKIRDLVAAN